MPQFGIYIHIPYCLQLCPYCDFAKYEVGKVPDQAHYTELLLKEIRQKRKFVPYPIATSIYFGGGTPSLLLPKHFRAILQEIKNHFELKSGLEITMEINPGTLTAEQIEELLSLGINRFSVGVQTFDDGLLQKIGRKHSAQETEKTLILLQKNKVNFSCDLLFALPNQTFAQVESDLEKMVGLGAHHISTYYLNVPENHFLAQARPTDDAQIEMFHFIEDFLEKNNILRYEISNFAREGFQSQHNKIYWTQQPYWGLGLSSHSYFPQDGFWGTRFFNPRSYDAYERTLLTDKLFLPENVEKLEQHQAMTEFCYTHLRRTQEGFSLDEFLKYFAIIPKMLQHELTRLTDQGLLEKSGKNLILSRKGRILSNLVFERLTFLREDLY
jgi:oxygen-independent coproporphyrinogen-3 oxidase